MHPPDSPCQAGPTPTHFWRMAMARSGASLRSPLLSPLTSTARTLVTACSTSTIAFCGRGKSKAQGQAGVELVGEGARQAVQPAHAARGSTRGAKQTATNGAWQSDKCPATTPHQQHSRMQHSSSHC